jgi:hypothetical protein
MIWTSSRPPQETKMSFALRFALPAFLALCSCATDEEPAPELDESPYISLNALAPEALHGSGDALAALAGDALDGAATELVDSEPGRMLLSYVARCALPAGDHASFPRAGGSDLVAPGAVGIASGWKDGPLGGAGRRLVTACLMAHVNAVGTQVPISVRSETLRDASLVEKLLFPAQEMAVYGDIFAPPSERELFVCFGRAVAQSLGGNGGLGGALGLPSYLDYRMCSVSESCGFNRVGACYRWTGQPGVTKSACEVQSGNLYERCHETPIQDGASPAWDDTVSVYLQPADLALLVAGYVDLLCELTAGEICDLLGQ